MHDGLKIITLPGGYYGRSITRVGWLRRVGGDEWELLGGRTIVRTESPRVGGLEILASSGPKGYKLGEASKTVEHIHRLIIRRSIVADPKVWNKDCPQPKDWSAA